MKIEGEIGLGLSRVFTVIKKSCFAGYGLV